jgi:hypothetical protein
MASEHKSAQSALDVQPLSLSALTIRLSDFASHQPPNGPFGWFGRFAPVDADGLVRYLSEHLQRFRSFPMSECYRRIRSERNADGIIVFTNLPDVETWLRLARIPIRNAHRWLDHYGLTDGAPDEPAAFKDPLETDLHFSKLLRFVRLLAKRDNMNTSREKEPKRIVGRKRLAGTDESERLALNAEWQRAKESGICRKDFCRDRRINTRFLETSLEWERQRNKRKK